MPTLTAPEQLRQLAQRATQHANPVTLAECLAQGFEVLARTMEAAPAPAPAPAPAAKTGRKAR